MYDPIENEDEVRGCLPHQAERLLRLKRLRSLLAAEPAGVSREEIYRRGFRLAELEALRKRGLARPQPRAKGTGAAEERWVAVAMEVKDDPDFTPEKERMV